MQINIDTRRLTSFALVAFILGGALGGVLWNMGGVYIPTSDIDQVFGNMQRFTSYDELKDYVEEYGSGYYGVKGRGFIGDLTFSLAPLAGSDMQVYYDSAEFSSLAPSSNDYSGTNVQVEGVDEADVVKTDGEYIYYVKGKQVIIIKAYPAEEAGIVARINFDSYVSDIYVSGDRLVVFTSAGYYYGYYYYEDIEEKDLIPGARITSLAEMVLLMEEKDRTLFLG